MTVVVVVEKPQNLYRELVEKNRKFDKKIPKTFRRNSRGKLEKSINEKLLTIVRPSEAKSKDLGSSS